MSDGRGQTLVRKWERVLDGGGGLTKFSPTGGGGNLVIIKVTYYNTTNTPRAINSHAYELLLFYINITFPLQKIISIS